MDLGAVIGFLGSRFWSSPYDLRVFDDVPGVFDNRNYEVPL